MNKCDESPSVEVNEPHYFCHISDFCEDFSSIELQVCVCVCVCVSARSPPPNSGNTGECHGKYATNASYKCSGCNRCSGCKVNRWGTREFTTSS